MTGIPDFEKHVSDVRGAIPLPIEGRHVEAKTNSIPDFQSATQEYAESQDSLSAIGTTVAQSASNQMAVKLGYETGKNPHGDLLPPITEFDKNFENSYHQQANATLTLQGQKLLDDTQVQMAQSVRLTPQLIDRTHQQLQIGLNKIAESAPTAIKGELQAQFDSQILQHTTQYKDRMLRENREDDKNTYINSMDLGIKNAQELATIGNNKGAQTAVVSVIQMAESAEKNKYITPGKARVQKETAIQARINGQYTFQAKQALNEKKYPEFIDNLSKNKPEGMSNEVYLNMLTHVNSQIGFLQNLRTQQENLESTKFNVRLALNPNTISGGDIEQLRSELSPSKFEDIHLNYIKAMRTFNKDKNDSQDLMNNWNDPRAHAASSPKVIDQTFEKQVSSYQQQGINLQDAEVLVASQAGGTIPEFTRSIRNRLSSKNPSMIESAAQQIHALTTMESSNALNGLDRQDMAMFHSFASIRDSMEPNKAAQELHDRIYNKGNDEVSATEQNWNNQLHTKKPTGTSNPDYGLIVAGISKEQFLNVGDKTVFGNDLFDEYKSDYIASGGDDKTARKMLQQSVQNNYGYTNVNGIKQFTKHPIEKVLNLPDNAIGVVQQDIYNKLDKNFIENKKAYDKGEINEYWQLTPRESPEQISKNNTDISIPKNYFQNENDISLVKDKDLTNYSKSIEVIHHVRGKGIGEKYTIVLKSNPFSSTTNDEQHPTHAGWDIAVNSGSGISSLAKIAPYLGIITYDPDVAYIKSAYTKLHPLK